MKKTLLTTTILSLVPTVLAHAGEDENNHHMTDGAMGGMAGMMTGGYGYGWMIFGWLVGVLAVAALVLLIIWLTKEVQKK